MEMPNALSVWIADQDPSREQTALCKKVLAFLPSFTRIQPASFDHLAALERCRAIPTKLSNPDKPPAKRYIRGGT